jgi:hypothetical protein
MFMGAQVPFKKWVPAVAGPDTGASSSMHQLRQTADSTIQGQNFVGMNGSQRQSRAADTGIFRREDIWPAEDTNAIHGVR